MSVVENLFAMRGVWRDRLQGYEPDGTAMAFDTHAAVQGPYPFENLVYIDFDGERYEQTNVIVAGRPATARSFAGIVVDGVLRFGSNGPGDPGQIGVSGGPGILIYLPAEITDNAKNFADPDYITFDATTRRRICTLYRSAVVKRILRVDGVRLAATAEERVAIDPRGLDGPVHAPRLTSDVFLDPNAHAIERPIG